MTTAELKKHWAEQCTDFKEIKGNGLCGIHKFMWTFGVITHLGQWGFYHRWCYETYEEAKIALDNWDGVGDPPGLWKKYKGADGEWSNKVRHDFNEEFDEVSPHYKS